MAQELRQLLELENGLLQVISRREIAQQETTALVESKLSVQLENIAQRAPMLKPLHLELVWLWTNLDFGIRNHVHLESSVPPV